MSTNKTPNYDLHSWVPQDDFHMTEINENFTKLDTALKTEATSAAQERSALQTALNGKAAASAVTTLSQQLAGKADAATVNTLSQQVAGKATAAAVNALSQQLAGKADKTEVAKKVEPIVGTYVGDGSEVRQITLAKKPAFVHLEIKGGFRYASNYVFGGLATQAIPLDENFLVINNSGFQLNNTFSDSHVNEKNETYIYIAYCL